MRSFLSTAAKHVFVGLVSLASVVTLFSYFGNYDPPVSYIVAEANTQVVPQGGELILQWEVERSRRCYVEFDRQLIADVDGARERIELDNYIKEGGLPVAQRERFTTKVHIPGNMPVGRAMYRSTGLYSCNLFQRWKPIVVPAPEIYFTVLPKSQ